MDKRAILQKFASYAPYVDTQMLEKAFDYSIKAHAEQARASGEDYFVHCLAVAESLLDWKMDLPTIAAGLLHDVIEDTSVTAEKLRQSFGEEIMRLVVALTKLDKVQFSSRDDAQAENWRRMILATAQDIRVIIIKLADRLHNMQTISYLPPDKIERIAHETLSLYAPLAHRLGMFEIKGYLEDLSFAVLHPEEHQDIEAKVLARLPAREAMLSEFRKMLEHALSKSDSPHRVLARTKNLYSIYMKMQRQKKPFEDIQDALGVRLITDTVADCYALLGLLHTHFQPVPDTFTDYIAHPKLNLYKSLHTTVIGPKGECIEVQIRTEDMHRTAEYGIAAHWRYKTGEASKDAHLEEKLNWLRQWIEWLQDLDSPREFLDSLKTDLDLYQVFVFTPLGDVKALVQDATPIDFAYAVHTDIGHSCVGARVNNKMVKLDTHLKSGDIVEILTKKNSTPKRDWLKVVKSARARSKIRRWLREKGIAA
ncbi:MAG: bifunctional (p)ppGpp synthetase/guanosine-3',5'-bis(diphosphate) 3'-pyrophosphohydrolase [Elusimicrobia bacterium]|nr:bifunctional (p)ppGpp synthetase/guanosine-3',5'-bis(diphosphate) 3'-pyrophosphohydrolase [Elusimicrobiota bacterium]